MSFSIAPILEFAATAIYVALGLAALYGAFCVILLVRRISQKRFLTQTAADTFLDEVRDLLSQRNYEGIAELCDSPAYWSKAVAQLILVALESRDRGVAKIRRVVAERFEREILADLEYRTSWIATVVKSAPMLGLLGTVVGMINAFKQIAGASDAGIDPADLAGDISFALFTTALGLTVAIPLVLAGNMVSVRIGKLQDSVQEQLGEFVDDLDAVTQGEGGRTP
jgi:biopolymer transport protein ExbB/TolQ